MELLTKSKDRLQSFTAFVRCAKGNGKLSYKWAVYEQCKAVAESQASDAEEYEKMMKIVTKELKI